MSKIRPSLFGAHLTFLEFGSPCKARSCWSRLFCYFNFCKGEMKMKCVKIFDEKTLDKLEQLGYTGVATIKKQIFDTQYFCIKSIAEIRAAGGRLYGTSKVVYGNYGTYGTSKIERNIVHLCRIKNILKDV